MNSGLNGLPSHFAKPANLVGQALYVGSQELAVIPIFFGPVRTPGVPIPNFKVSYGTTTIFDWGVRSSTNFTFGASGKTTLDDFGDLVLTSGTIRATAHFASVNNNPYRINQRTEGVWSWSPSTNEQVAPDTGISKITPLVVAIGNGTTGDKTGWLQWGGQARVSTQFDKTSDTALANVPGLSVNVAAGRTYRFEATLFTVSNVAGGVQSAIGGTCTATSIVYEGETTAAAAVGAQTRATALGTSVGGVTTVTAARIDIEGVITVNAAGTLTVQFAQNSSNVVASSVLVGSSFIMYDMP